MKKIFFKNFFNLIFNQGVNILVAIIATPILFQKLGESSFGLMNLSFSIFMLLSRNKRSKQTHRFVHISWT